jgi:predicted DNA-binding transcriptional regulator YafY
MPGNADTLRRQWEMLRMIPRHPGRITARQLTERLNAEGYEVGKRTVERDLLNLSVPFPITSVEQGQTLHWSWGKHAAVFDLPGLNASEALAFKLVEQQLKDLVPASLLEQLAPHFKAAGEALSHAANVAAWTDKVRVIPPAQPLLPSPVDPQVQRVIYEALLTERQVEIEYLRKGEESPATHAVSLLGLVQRGPVTYLVARYYDYPNIRLLVLHRVKAARLNDEPAKRPEGFNLDAYIRAGSLAFGEGRFIRLVARFTDDAAAHLYETRLSEGQSLIREKGGSTRLIAKVPDTPQLMWWLLGFGPAVEVLQPAALRRKMSATAFAMAARYRVRANKGGGR